MRGQSGPFPPSPALGGVDVDLAVLIDLQSDPLVLSCISLITHGVARLFMCFLLSVYLFGDR